MDTAILRSKLHPQVQLSAQDWLVEAQEKARMAE
jgi:hypothetical protein